MTRRKDEVVEKSEGRALGTPDIIDGRYLKFNNLLGRGAYKEVYQAYDTVDTVDVAWNQIDLSQITSHDERDRILKECQMLKKLNHPRILKIRHQWYNNDTDKFYFTTPLLTAGSLRKYYRRERKINLKRVKIICKQILEALTYLHSFEPPVIHRDLKCDNIFIDGTLGDIIIGDLGLATTMPENNWSGAPMSVVGTPHWMAPELYAEKYDQQVDVWSFGMCILELMTNKVPFSECPSAPAVYQKVTRGEKPALIDEIVSASAKCFIKHCLEFNPLLRPTAKELLEHPFLLPRIRDTEEIQLASRIVPAPQMGTIIEDTDTLVKLKQQAAKETSHLAPPAKEKGRHHHKKSKKKKAAVPIEDQKEEVVLQKIQRHDDSTLKLHMTCYFKKKPPSAVAFDMNVSEDPAHLAVEMQRGLKLPAVYIPKVEACIRKALSHEEYDLKNQVFKKSTKMKRETVQAMERQARAAEEGLAPTMSAEGEPSVTGGGGGTGGATTVPSSAAAGAGGGGTVGDAAAAAYAPSVATPGGLSQSPVRAAIAMTPSDLSSVAGSRVDDPIYSEGPPRQQHNSELHKAQSADGGGGLKSSALAEARHVTEATLSSDPASSWVPPSDPADAGGAGGKVSLQPPIGGEGPAHSPPLVASAVPMGESSGAFALPMTATATTESAQDDSAAGSVVAAVAGGMFPTAELSTQSATYAPGVFHPGYPGSVGHPGYTTLPMGMPMGSVPSYAYYPPHYGYYPHLVHAYPGSTVAGPMPTGITGSTSGLEGPGSMTRGTSQPVQMAPGVAGITQPAPGAITSSVAGSTGGATPASTTAPGLGMTSVSDSSTAVFDPSSMVAMGEAASAPLAMTQINDMKRQESDTSNLTASAMTSRAVTSASAVTGGGSAPETTLQSGTEDESASMRSADGEKLTPYEFKAKKVADMYREILRLSDEQLLYEITIRGGQNVSLKDGQTILAQKLFEIFKKSSSPPEKSPPPDSVSTPAAYHSDAESGASFGRYETTSTSRQSPWPSDAATSAVAAAAVLADQPPAIRRAASIKQPTLDRQGSSSPMAHDTGSASPLTKERSIPPLSRAASKSSTKRNIAPTRADTLIKEKSEDSTGTFEMKDTPVPSDEVFDKALEPHDVDELLSDMKPYSAGGGGGTSGSSDPTATESTTVPPMTTVITAHKSRRSTSSADSITNVLPVLPEAGVGSDALTATTSGVPSVVMTGAPDAGSQYVPRFLLDEMELDWKEKDYETDQGILMKIRDEKTKLMNELLEWKQRQEKLISLRITQSGSSEPDSEVISSFLVAQTGKIETLMGRWMTFLTEMSEIINIQNQLEKTAAAEKDDYGLKQLFNLDLLAVEDRMRLAPMINGLISNSIDGSAEVMLRQRVEAKKQAMQADFTRWLESLLGLGHPLVAPPTVIPAGVSQVTLPITIEPVPSGGSTPAVVLSPALAPHSGVAGVTALDPSALATPSIDLALTQADVSDHSVHSRHSTVSVSGPNAVTVTVTSSAVSAAGVVSDGVSVPVSADEMKLGAVEHPETPSSIAGASSVAGSVGGSMMGYGIGGGPPSSVSMMHEIPAIPAAGAMIRGTSGMTGPMTASHPSTTMVPSTTAATHSASFHIAQTPQGPMLVQHGSEGYMAMTGATPTTASGSGYGMARITPSVSGFYGHMPAMYNSAAFRYHHPPTAMAGFHPAYAQQAPASIGTPSIGTPSIGGPLLISATAPSVTGMATGADDGQISPRSVTSSKAPAL